LFLECFDFAKKAVFQIIFLQFKIVIELIFKIWFTAIRAIVSKSMKRILHPDSLINRERELPRLKE